MFRIQIVPIWIKERRDYVPSFTHFFVSVKLGLTEERRDFVFFFSEAKKSKIAAISIMGKRRDKVRKTLSSQQSPPFPLNNKKGGLG